MATLAETLADPTRPSFLFGMFIILIRITLSFVYPTTTKRTSRSAPFSLKLALFSFSVSDDIRKRDWKWWISLCALLMDMVMWWWWKNSFTHSSLRRRLKLLQKKTRKRTERVFRVSPFPLAPKKIDPLLLVYECLYCFFLDWWLISLSL